LEKTRFAIIGGTGFEKLFTHSKRISAKTPYGEVKALFIGQVGDRTVVVLPRHGLDHSIPPHKINYRANIYALHEMGVERILATNAVGGISKKLEPGDAVVPNDFIDFTKFRGATFYDDAPVTHIDLTEPYCPEIRGLLIKNGETRKLRVWERAVLACTEGPRFETPAEIEMLRRLGCDIVGMTSFPEVVLARELEMCYASLCYVSNMAAGLQRRLTAAEVSKISKKILPVVEQVLIETVKGLPLKRENCPCADALKEARFK
jgi:5'-methylthioadenosine phosphorylase